MNQMDATIEVTKNGLPLPAHLYDGYLVHKAALERGGLRVLLLPRQTLLAGEDQTVPAEIAFTHAVPQSSTLAAVTFAQDRRLRRALFERRGVAKPAGASFSHRSLGRATKWVKRQGFPVNVKEAIGENDGREIPNVNTPEELEEAFTTLRLREEADRAPGRNPRISGYTTTRLTYTVDEDGRELAPPRTRMLVEKKIIGRPLCAFVVDGDVVGIVELDQSRTLPVADVTTTIGDVCKEAAVIAAEAIPGLGFAMIDLVEVKGRNPFKRPRYVVTELSERPRMAFLNSGFSEVAERVAHKLVESEAQRAKLRPGSMHSSIRCALKIDGLRDASWVADELVGAYAANGVTLSNVRSDDVLGTVTAVCEGSVADVAALNELLMSGDLVDDRAAAIEYSEDNLND